MEREIRKSFGVSKGGMAIYYILEQETQVHENPTRR